jgi:hypothetical protein
VELQNTIQGDINACINSCHGDAGLCQACVLGDIGRDIAGAGDRWGACSDKIIKQLSQYVTDAYNAAFGLGIPAPTVEQIAEKFVMFLNRRRRRKPRSVG